MPPCTNLTKIPNLCFNMFSLGVPSFTAWEHFYGNLSPWHSSTDDVTLWAASGGHKRHVNEAGMCMSVYSPQLLKQVTQRKFLRHCGNEVHFWRTWKPHCAHGKKLLLALGRTAFTKQTEQVKMQVTHFLLLQHFEAWKTIQTLSAMFPLSFMHGYL